MLNDLRFTLRTLGRSPLFTAAAIASLALGIGANTSIFSLLDQVLFRLLPVRDPERLVVLHNDYRAPGWSLSDNHETVFSHPMYKDLRDRAQVFSGVAARAGAAVSVSGTGETERAAAEMVSGNFFDVMGVRPLLGRTFTAADDGAPGASPVLVLTYGYWMRRFGGSPAVLGRKVNLNGHPFLVVGVAVPSFRGVLSGQMPDFFVPLAMKRQVTPNWDGLDDRRIRWLSIFARLKSGIAPAQAQAGVSAVWRPIIETELAQLGRLRDERERQRFLNQRLELRPASQGINSLRKAWEKPLLALMAMVGLVLLIACANVAGLLLARASGRRREIAVRLAIGAGRGAIARQLLLESTTLAVAGGLLGLAVAYWTTRLLLGMLPAEPGDQWLSARLDLRLLAFNLSLSLLAGLVFGLAPALRATRPDVAGALKDQTGSLGSGGQARFRKVLVASQVALSLLLLVGAGLFARSLSNLMKVHLGFDKERLMTFAVNPKLNGYTDQQLRLFYRDLLQRLALVPGVRAVGAADPGPLTHSESAGNITVEGYQPKGDEDPGASNSGVSPGFFRALGIPLLAGREFTDRDDAAAPKTVIVNETFARRYFAGASPLGRHMTFGGGNVKLDREIVGVSADNLHGNFREPVRATVFLPYPQMERLDRLTFYVRTAREENALAPLVRRAVRELDPNLPVFDMKSMQTRVEESLDTDRMIATLSIAFGVLATWLAAIGLYGVIAYSVTRRTGEIGLRMALGALPRDVLALVAHEAGALILAGTAAGLAAAFLLSRLVESQLFGLKANDPIAFGGATALLIIVALLAGFIPGQRAARIDPMRALRHE